VINVGLCKDGYWRESERYEGKKYIGCASMKNRTEKEAQKAALRDLSEKITEAKNGRSILDKNTTVKKWSETWLATYVTPRVREPGQPKLKNTMTQKSYAMYEDKLKYVLSAIGNLKLCDVRDTNLQTILNRQAGKSKSHVNKIMIVIQAMFRQAYASRLISYDPSVSLTLPMVTEGKRRSLTDKERELLHKAAEMHRCGLWAETLLATGIRPGESAPLLIKDFDFDTGLLNIDKDIESGTYSVSDPKTKAGIRKIPISDELVPKLKAAFAGKSPFEYAFPQTDGKKMKTQECLSNDWESFKRCMDILGGAKTVVFRKTSPGGKLSPEVKPIISRSVRTISEYSYAAVACGRIMTHEDDDERGSILADDLVCYCLRHTFCTDLQKKGVPVDIAKYLMGHEDIRTTANIYAHADDSTAILAAAYINPTKDVVKDPVKISNTDS
jgi:integrase